MVDLEVLYKVLGGMEGETITIAPDGGSLVVTSESGRGGVTISEVDDSSYIVMDEDVDWYDAPGGFARALGLCSFSASSDMTRGVLTGVYVVGDKVISSDDYRISMCTLVSPVESMLIPAQAAAKVSSFPMVMYSVGSSWVYFRTSDMIVFGTLAIKGDYPDVTEFVTIEGTRLVLPKILGDDLSLVGEFSDGTEALDKVVEVQISGGILTSRAEGEEGWMEKPLAVDNDQISVQFHVNPLFLAEVLRSKKRVKMVVSDNLVLLVSGTFKHAIVRC